MEVIGRSAAPTTTPMANKREKFVHIITHECLEGDAVGCIIKPVPESSQLEPDDYVRVGDLSPVLFGYDLPDYSGEPSVMEPDIPTLLEPTTASPDISKPTSISDGSEMEGDNDDSGDTESTNESETEPTSDPPVSSSPIEAVAVTTEVPNSITQVVPTKSPALNGNEAVAQKVASTTHKEIPAIQKEATSSVVTLGRPPFLHEEIKIITNADDPTLQSLFHEEIKVVTNQAKPSQPAFLHEDIKVITKSDDRIPQSSAIKFVAETMNSFLHKDIQVVTNQTTPTPLSEAEVWDVLPFVNPTSFLHNDIRATTKRDNQAMATKYEVAFQSGQILKPKIVKHILEVPSPSTATDAADTATLTSSAHRDTVYSTRYVTVTHAGTTYVIPDHAILAFTPGSTDGLKAEGYTMLTGWLVVVLLLLVLSMFGVVGVALYAIRRCLTKREVQKCRGR
ncbi:hypothetical protein K469DRAFT_803547 [Zopfia rhizophila CBS 207.26]|uniref:Uncharacterized protein n=1 Tax=Zopfia rhizophila CBS 207.26 TaxID=1314779 RepID=A0A6A6DL24_9PEZI|nr:hypothetical protein K469DRAFT_803547 [Zopfia rhizophila CBS 207.26]